MSKSSSVSGIYMIRCNQNGKVYIGQSRHIQNRWRAHRTGLRTGKHGDPHLQAAWRLYGEAAFEFTLLYDGQGDLDALEMQYIQQYQALDPDRGYNLESVVEGIKVHSPPEERYQRSVALKGRRKTPAQIEAAVAGKRKRREESQHAHQ